MFVYVATYLIMLVIYLLWNIIINRLVNACKYMEKYVKLKQDREKVEADFYTCVNFRTLRLELQDTLKSLKNAESNRAAGDCYGPNLTREDLSNYIEVLYRRILAIRR
jgi:hypothetical protein